MKDSGKDEREPDRLATVLCGEFYRPIIRAVKQFRLNYITPGNAGMSQAVRELLTVANTGTESA